MKSFLLTLITLFSLNGIFAQSDSAKFYFKKGTDEQTARRYLVAAKYFDKAIQFDAKYTDAYIENGRVNLSMRRVAVAQTNFEKAYQLQPDNQVVIKELASLYINNRQFQQANDLAQKCKNCPEVERILAMSSYQMEDYAKAISSLEKFLVKNPGDAEATYTLGRSYLEIEDFKSAIKMYQKALTLDPTKNVWMYELALQLYNSNDYPNAKKYFLMAADAGYPKSNDFLENLGFVYINTGDVENGLKNLIIVLSRKPNNKELLNDIAQALYSAKRYEEALGYYQKLLELNPKDANSLYMAGITFQKMGQKDRGIAMCDEAIKLDPALAKNRQKKGDQFGL
ncbi:MAG: Tetratricopeptide 2 repeat-containing protein [Chitinophagaceae bacterium]|nr:Tetratricopeptide 2 repeat-containing protein [Chitinophagaceae bacterium]